MASSKTSPSLLSVLSFSFDHFLTDRIVKLIYLSALIGTALTALAVLAAGVMSGAALLIAAPQQERFTEVWLSGGIVALVLGVLGALLCLVAGVLGSRVVCEFAIVVFRIADHTRAIAEALSAQRAP